MATCKRCSRRNRLENFVRRNRRMLRALPAILDRESDESRVMRELVELVVGNPTSAVPQCGLLTIPASEDFASAVFLGNTWALTSAHFFEEQSDTYLFSLPVSEQGDIRKSNTFQVDPILAPNKMDLALLRLDSVPAAPGITLASDAELAAAGAVQLCGFGSDDCELPSLGIKRLSNAIPLLPNAAAMGIVFDPVTQFVLQNPPALPLTCDSDSGGAALIPDGAGNFKLAGIIVDQVNVKAAICMRLSAFTEWIRNTTGLPL